MDAQEFVNVLRTGTLSVDEIGRGMHKSFVNATQLIEDAETLLEKRPGRAISLAVLAIEEIAKVVLLANAAARAAGGPVEWKVIQQELDLRSHQEKLTIFAIYGRAILNRIASRSEKPNFYEEEVPTGIAPLLDLFKQLGFYVDVGHGQFMSPDEFGRDNRDWAEWLIRVAKERLASFEQVHGTETRSITLARQAAELAGMVLEAGDQAQLKERILEFVNRQRRTH